jgi:hypothetical protein
MLLFMDSFDHYATADLLEKWSTQATSGFAGGTRTIGAFGRRATNGFRLHAQPNTANSGDMSKAVSPGDNTVIVGVSFRFATGGSLPYTLGETPCIFAITRVGASQIWLYLNTITGEVTIARSSGGSFVGLGTSSIGLPLNAHTYIELKAVIAPGTGGSAELRFNGTPVLTLTGVNTANTGVAGYESIRLGGLISNAGSSGNNQDFDYDDLYVCDGSGASANDFLGDCRVDVRLPTGPGATTGWTPSAGANWECVDDTVPNDDTDHNTIGTSGAIDTFPVPDAPPDVTIHGVQFNLTAKKTDAGLCSIAAVVRHGGADYAGPPKNPGTTFANLMTILPVNPGTSASWTEAEFNAAEFGYKRV